MTPLTHIATTPDALEPFEARWDGLRVRLSASPFSGPTLFRGWLEELGRQAEPFVVIVEDEGEVVAVAPWVRRGPIAYSLPGRVLVAGELVAADGTGETAWTLILRAVREQSRVGAVVVPHLTPGDGARGAQSACTALGYPYRLWGRFSRYRLNLAETTYEQWWAGWSQRGRYNVSRSRRNLTRAGKLELVEHSVADGYSTMQEMHVRQWSAEWTHSWIHTEEGTRIDLELGRSLPSGVLLATLDGRPIAGVLWLDSGTRRTLYYNVRDPDWRIGSPGELVFVEFIRRSFEEGMTEIDTMGIAAQKDHWRLVRQDGYELVVATRKLAGGALMLARDLQLRRRRELPDTSRPTHEDAQPS